MIIIPGVGNAIQFWIQDSILKKTEWKTDEIPIRESLWHENSLNFGHTRYKRFSSLSELERARKAEARGSKSTTRQTNRRNTSKPLGSTTLTAEQMNSRLKAADFLNLEN